MAIWFIANNFTKFWPIT